MGNAQKIQSPFEEPSARTCSEQAPSRDSDERSAAQSHSPSQLTLTSSMRVAIRWRNQNQLCFELLKSSASFLASLVFFFFFFPFWVACRCLCNGRQVLRSEGNHKRVAADDTAIRWVQPVAGLDSWGIPRPGPQQHWSWVAGLNLFSSSDIITKNSNYNYRYVEELDCCSLLLFLFFLFSIFPCGIRSALNSMAITKQGSSLTGL